VAPQVLGKEAVTPPKGWPVDGAIEFKDVVMGYFPDAKPALRGVNFRFVWRGPARAAACETPAALELSRLVCRHGRQARPPRRQLQVCVEPANLRRHTQVTWCRIQKLCISLRVEARRRM
jgi:hypothetical protein